MGFLLQIHREGSEERGWSWGLSRQSPRGHAASGTISQPCGHQVSHVTASWVQGIPQPSFWETQGALGSPEHLSSTQEAGVCVHTFLSNRRNHAPEELLRDARASHQCAQHPLPRLGAQDGTRAQRPGRLSIPAEGQGAGTRCPGWLSPQRRPWEHLRHSPAVSQLAAPLSRSAGTTHKIRSCHQ